MYKNKVCVVIPIHASDPNKNELLSFIQCFKILFKHPIYVVAPSNLDLYAYRKVVPNFNLVSINPKWQSSILNYNKLKLSNYFYSLFNNYEYLLTYELDAFVFKDELLHWCEKGYDYIGAPWFEGFTNPTKKIIGVGNSGFSLRKIKSITRNLNKLIYTESFTGNKRAYINKIYSFVQKNLSSLLNENMTIQKSNILFEDNVIWSNINKFDNYFKIAPIEDAILFSFEANPRYLFEMTNQTIPFGCHAWERYDIEFWQDHITCLK